MTDNTLVLHSCTDAPRVEHDLCSDTSVQSSGDGNDVISIKIEGEEICVYKDVDIRHSTFCVKMVLFLSK